MERAVRQDPGNVLAQYDLGLTYLMCRRIDDAVACFRRAVALNDRFMHAHYRLGIALELRGNVDEAIVTYRRAISLPGAPADAHSRLGDLLLARGRRNEATDAFRAAAAAAPDTTEGRLNLVRALLIEDRDTEAEAAVRRTLARDPQSGVAHWMLGTILAESGRFREAHAAFEPSIALNPQQGIGDHDLVRRRPLSEADQPLIERMRGVTGALHRPDQQVLLQLAIGKALDDLKDYRGAIEHYEKANRIKKAIVPFDRNALARRIDGLIARITPEFLAKYGASGSELVLPLLILGMPRWGTTLVEQILSNHCHVAGAGELHFWHRRGLIFEQTADEKIADFQGQATLDYLARLRAIAPNAARVTDKMPFNFLWAGPIHLVFPRAVIVHCRRNPLDTCLSVFSTDFAPRPDFSTDRDDLLFYYRQYLRLMAHWRTVLPRERFIEVDYEELVANPEAVSRQLVAACGLELGRGLPAARVQRASGEDGKQMAGAPANSSNCRWALEALQTLDRKLPGIAVGGRQPGRRGVRRSGVSHA